MVLLTGPVACTVAPAIGAPVAADVTVPRRTPVGPRGDCATAARASSRPCPQTLLFPAVPPQVRSEVSTAVWSSSARVWATSPLNAGAADQIRATVPARCGAAIEVPLKLA